MTHQTFPKPTKKGRKNLNKERSLFIDDILLSEYYPNIGAISATLYAELEERSGGQCEECGANNPELHHIISRRRVAHIHNIVHLCKACHKVPDGVHGNDKLDRKYKDKYRIWCEENGYNEKQINYLMGVK